ncbi:hypothetical protein NDU88_005259 [Pleurodeles waltl]|uniref:Uncharacterized protein n=1 Tax=Pleurodeles waltl TaxID=8319 RepID=A0AAV7L0A1_PLEWA|nr:hypothetical protein NDU88_005259 [Pleurodeles waltl]
MHAPAPPPAAWERCELSPWLKFRNHVSGIEATQLASRSMVGKKYDRDTFYYQVRGNGYISSAREMLAFPVNYSSKK